MFPKRFDLSGRKTGSCAVQGDILRLYEQSGGPLGPLGYPKSNEQSVPGTDIRYNDFENGVIFWSRKTGARNLSALQLHLGMVRTGEINDGFTVLPPSSDHSAELMVYTTVNVNGKPREINQQQGGHHGTSYDINTNYDVSPITSATSVDFKIRAVDYDSGSDDEYLATIEKKFDITNCWGLDNDVKGVYISQQATDRSKDAPRPDSVLFDYRIGPPSATITPDEPFRKRAWWNFKNFHTPVLSRRIYANTFRDVQFTASGWEEFVHPFDTLFYDLAYKHLAEFGNCFGNSLEAQFALAGRSVFAEPVRQYDLSNPQAIADVINVKHGYQLGGEHVRWIISNLSGLNFIRPLKVYGRVRAVLERQGQTLVSFTNIPSFGGHTVLAYDFEDGKNGAPNKIFVADPNVWEYDEHNPDPSAIEINGDDTFKFVTGSTEYRSRRIVAGLLPGCVMLDSPFYIF